MIEVCTIKTCLVIKLGNGQSCMLASTYLRSSLNVCVKNKGISANILGIKLPEKNHMIALKYCYNNLQNHLSSHHQT